MLWIFSLRYIPPVNAFLMFLYVAGKLLGVPMEASELVSGISVSVLIAAWLASKAHCFCALHRGFIYYASLVYGCIYFERWYSFGTLLTSARWFVFWIGALLFIYTFINIKDFNNGCGKL